MWRIFLYGCLLLIPGIGRAQTEADLRIDYDSLVCVNDTSAHLRAVTVTNLSMGDVLFEGGTFRMEWGDGQRSEWGASKELPHEYAEYASYEMIFSWTSADGTRQLRKKCPVTLKRGPVAGFNIPSAGSCVNQKTVFQITDYEKESPETEYIFHYKDEEIGTFLQEDVLRDNGVVTHIFEEQLCEQTISMTVRNQCVTEGKISENSTLNSRVVTVLTPASIVFGVREPVCTGEPFEMKIDKSSLSICEGVGIEYVWDLEGQGGYKGEQPGVRPYDKPGEYEAVLIARVGSVACANDTARRKIRVIERAKADFSLAADTFCYNGMPVPVFLQNLSGGDEIRSCIWEINGEIVQESGEKRDLSYQFEREGSYRVGLTMSNSCSTDQKDTVIVIRRSPEIEKFGLEDQAVLCPDRPGGLFLDMSDYLYYQWYGNPEAAEWTITPEDGVVYEPGAGPDRLYPRFTLQAGRSYTLEVRLKGVKVGGDECGDATKRKAVRTIRVSDPEIVPDIQPDPVAGADGMIRICEGEQVGFKNLSTGEDLKHHWIVEPLPGAECDPGKRFRFISGNEDSPAPVLKFEGYGDFRVTDTLKVYCRKEVKSFSVHVGKAPTISVWDFGRDTLICAGNTLNMEDYVYCDWYNNEPRFTWKFTPDLTADKTRNYPRITFPDAGTYSLSLELEEKSCPDSHTQSSASVNIRVRSTSLVCEVAIGQPADIYCEGAKIRFINRATDEEGSLAYSWKIVKEQSWEKSPEKETGILSEQFDEYGDYRVIGIATGYCDEKSDTVKLTIHKNPEVVLRDTVICPGRVDMRHFVSYEWYNNTDRTVTWEVSGPPDGYEGELNVPYPEFLLKEKGDYRIRATIPGPGCPEGAEGLTAGKSYHVYDTLITGDIVPEGRDGVTDPSDICEGQAIGFQNTTAAEAGISWYWWVEGGQAGGWQFADGQTTSTAQYPVLTFGKYGDYTVKVRVTGKCAEKDWSFPVTVRGVPEIDLRQRMDKICEASGEAVDLSNYLTFTDRKHAEIRPEWTVSPAAGVSWVPGCGPDTDFPRVEFGQAAHYTLTLTAFSKCADQGRQVFRTDIDVIRQFIEARFDAGQDSVGCTDDPRPYRVTLLNQSEGDSLSYEWAVIPRNVSGGGWEFAEGDRYSKAPALQFSEPGFYEVKLRAANICGYDDSVFRLKAFARPEVTIADVTFVCEPYDFSGTRQIRVDEHNDAIRQVKWQIRPDLAVDNAGADYLPGSSDGSFYPDIRFGHGLYQVEATWYNRCQTPAVRTFTVSVDRFVPIEPLEDQEICEQEEARLLTALPAGGSWSVRDAGSIPDAADILYRDAAGDYYFHPLFGAYEQKDVELIYRRDNGSCIARDTLNMRIWPLPYVEAGESLEMCLNHDPRLLTGLDSAAGESWQVNRGTWKLRGQNLENHYFTATAAGDFPLEYSYTDLHGCTHRDFTVMTVHALPCTEFTVADRNCIYTGVTFTPVDSVHNTFEWSFGDESPLQNSEGKVVHEYDGYGFREVICRAENQYHCRDTSVPRQIEIVNLPPPAFFDIDRVEGCPPFEAVIRIDREVYRDDHNYLSFHWDYGEGTQTDSLGPILPKAYEASAWDTTYVTRFTVSNMCDTVSYDTTLTVYSVPKVSFALVHEWECDPVWLELQNTTTGNRCVFNWTFTNGRTGEVVERTGVRNPQYEFRTDSASTTYYINLKAVNQCDEDEFTDSLVVKPRSIRAHFTPLERASACENEEIFFRNNSTDTVASILNTYWNFGDGARATEWSPRHRYEEEGTYIVRLKIDNGCGWDTTSLPVTIYPLPNLEIRSENEHCEADTFTFVLKSDQELANIEWQLGDGHRAYKDSLRYCYEGYGVFPVVVTGVSAKNNRCADSVRKEVTVYNKPILQITPLDTVTCYHLLYAPEVTGEAFLMWDYGDDSGLTSSPEHWYENVSDTVERFRVIAYAETGKGCRSEYERTVTVYNKPYAAIEKEVVQGNPQRVTFINLSEKYTDCIWDLPLRGIVHSPGNQVEEFSEQGTYPVCLIAVNYFGCTDTAFLEHDVLIKGLYFPNTFIPHSQNGQVNRFRGIGMGLQEYKLEIFDQYGNKIWETRALEDGRPSEGWDGCNAKGERMPQGIYIWRAKAIFADSEVWTGKNNESGVPQTTQGTVLLLRE